MQTHTVCWKRAILAGLLATLVGFIVGFGLYSLANPVYARYSSLPYAKPVDSTVAYLIQMVVGGAVLNMLLALVYATIYPGLPGKTGWQKGLAFGLLLLIVNMLPIAFNTWMQIAQPVVLIIIEALNRTVGLLITGLIIAVCSSSALSVDAQKS